MMTPRDHMSHDLSYFSGPRTSGAAGAEGTGGLSFQGSWGTSRCLQLGKVSASAQAGDGAEQIGVWHLLGRQHVCEVRGGTTAPR